jgi:hypothetical protein
MVVGVTVILRTVIDVLGTSVVVLVLVVGINVVVGTTPVKT